MKTGTFTILAIQMLLVFSIVACGGDDANSASVTASADSNLVAEARSLNLFDEQFTEDMFEELDEATQRQMIDGAKLGEKNKLAAQERAAKAAETQDQVREQQEERARQAEEYQREQEARRAEQEKQREERKKEQEARNKENSPEARKEKARQEAEAREKEGKIKKREDAIKKAYDQMEKERFIEYFKSIPRVQERFREEYYEVIVGSATGPQHRKSREDLEKELATLTEDYVHDYGEAQWAKFEKEIGHSWEAKRRNTEYQVKIFDALEQSISIKEAKDAATRIRASRDSDELMSKDTKEKERFEKRLAALEMLADKKAIEALLDETHGSDVGLGVNTIARFIADFSTEADSEVLIKAWSHCTSKNDWMPIIVALSNLHLSPEQEKRLQPTCIELVKKRSSDDILRRQLLLVARQYLNNTDALWWRLIEQALKNTDLTSPDYTHLLSASVDTPRVQTAELVARRHLNAMKNGSTEASDENDLPLSGQTEWLALKWELVPVGIRKEACRYVNDALAEITFIALARLTRWIAVPDDEESYKLFTLLRDKFHPYVDTIIKSHAGDSNNFAVQIFAPGIQIGTVFANESQYTWNYTLACRGLARSAPKKIADWFFAHWGEAPGDCHWLAAERDRVVLDYVLPELDPSLTFDFGMTILKKPIPDVHTLELAWRAIALGDDHSKQLTTLIESLQTFDFSGEKRSLVYKELGGTAERISPPDALAKILAQLIRKSGKDANELLEPVLQNPRCASFVVETALRALWRSGQQPNPDVVKSVNERFSKDEAIHSLVTSLELKNIEKMKGSELAGLLKSERWADIERIIAKLNEVDDKVFEQAFPAVIERMFIESNPDTAGRNFEAGPPMIVSLKDLTEKWQNERRLRLTKGIIEKLDWWPLSEGSHVFFPMAVLGADGAVRGAGGMTAFNQYPAAFGTLLDMIALSACENALSELVPLMRSPSKGIRSRSRSWGFENRQNIGAERLKTVFEELLEASSNEEEKKSLESWLKRMKSG